MNITELLEFSLKSRAPDTHHATRHPSCYWTTPRWLELVANPPTQADPLQTD